VSDGILESKKINVGAILSSMAGLLIVSICIALYLGANEEIEESIPAEGEVTIAEMEDYLHKLTYLVGPRNLKTEPGRKAIRSAAAMIDGTLGPSNTGYEITQKMDPAEGLLWRTLWVSAGNKESKEVVVIAIPYGNEGHEVAFALGLGEFLTKHRPNYHLKLAFYPPLENIGRAWLKERVISKEENLRGVIELKAGGSDSTSSDSVQENEVSIQLHLDSQSPRDGTAARFLRMLPVTKLIADTFVD